MLGKVVATIIIIFFTAVGLLFFIPIRQLFGTFEGVFVLGVLFCEVMVGAYTMWLEANSTVEIIEQLKKKGYTDEEVKEFLHLKPRVWLKVHKKEETSIESKDQEEKPKIEKEKEKAKSLRVLPVAVTTVGLAPGVKSLVVCPNCGSSVVPVRLKTGDFLCPICGINLVEGKGSDVGSRKW